MNHKKIRIIFMGTPDFAVPSLQTLVDNGYHIVAVITAPDKPAGRGMKLQASPVKKCAIENGLNLLQPVSLKDKAFIKELKNLQPDLQVVVAFRMLPEVVWGMPSLGTFNLHASLLPQYRGAAPIHWAIVNGEKKTGVTTFFLQHEIDTGEVLFQEKTDITEEDNLMLVYSRLMNIGKQLVLKTVQAIETDDINPVPQKNLLDGALKQAPKISKETCQIDWHKTTEEVYNLIRGMSPFPSAWTVIGNDKQQWKMKIFSAVKHTEQIGKPGIMFSDNQTFIKVACLGGCVEITELQLEGRKRMKAIDFLRGFSDLSDCHIELI